MRITNQPEQKSRADLGASLSELGTTSKLEPPSKTDPSYEHLNNIGRAISTAQNALSAVSDIRTKQLELAQKSESSANPEQRASYQTEFDSLQSEISRVQSAATFNGVNVVQNQNSYTLQVTASANSSLSIEDNSAIVTGVSQSLFTNYGLSVSSTAGASDAADQLQQIGDITRSALFGVNSAYGKAEDSVKKFGPDSEATITSGYQLQSDSEAQQLANKVAEDIKKVVSADPSGEATKKLIESVASQLEPDRVSKLLGEE